MKTMLLHLSTFFLLLIAAVHGFPIPTTGPFNVTCPAHSCGNGVNISYPFFEITSSQTFCGYPGFGLTCSGPDYSPEIQLLDGSYIVKNISYANRSLTLVDSDVATSHSNCPRARHTLNISTRTPLTNPNQNLTFYFDCNNVPESVPWIECLNKSEGGKSYVFEEGNETEGYDWVGGCGERVTVATAVEDWVNVADVVKRFAEAMLRGFDLRWGMMADCGKCEASGGRCGYAADEVLLCYCEDGKTANLECKKENSWDLTKILVIGLSVCGGTILVMFAIFFVYQRRRKTTSAFSSYVTRSISSNLSSINDPEKMGGLFGVKFFTYDELQEATNNFHQNREIGDGGFGTVYLGKLQDGRNVAVKRLYENNFKRVEQFLNEVQILTRLRHKHLVQLYGCTSRHSRELLLVYEYIANGTVADHLHGKKAKPGSLSWQTRLKIAVETASALKYLHASDIIHRDVKTNNILLDENFTVKVADFGLSRLFPLDVTHVSTAPQGTPGYVDPDYHQCYQLTSKSDVYSFGVVLVELISSKTAVDITRHRHEINLSNMAINKIQSDALDELVDPSLGFNTDPEVQNMIRAVAELVFRCLQIEKDVRPSMEEVLEILTHIQRGESHNQENPEELDIFSDEFVLLKSDPLKSPDTVTAKWASVSHSTASNTSG